MASSLGLTRTEEDFVTHMARTVAEYDGREADVGQKDQRGIRKSMATRAALLDDPTHRMMCHYTPKHASWMHQSEMWCSIIVRKLLKRASCTSVEELKAQVSALIEYFNATLAKPFECDHNPWGVTYIGILRRQRLQAMRPWVRIWQHHPPRPFRRPSWLPTQSRLDTRYSTIAKI